MYFPVLASLLLLPLIGIEMKQQGKKTPNHSIIKTKCAVCKAFLPLIP